jgi:hypothetical protein
MELVYCLVVIDFVWLLSMEVYSYTLERGHTSNAFERFLTELLDLRKELSEE